MCGIWGRIKTGAAGASKQALPTSSDILRAETYTDRLRGRGPEGTCVAQTSSGLLGFTRLAINGLHPAGMQPMRHTNTTWVCNGELYNWAELASRLDLGTLIGEEHQSVSDCSILGPLWDKFKTTPEVFFRALDGVFAVILVDDETGIVTIGRDPYGVRPLFELYDSEQDVTYYASEMKALVGLVEESRLSYIDPVQPGTYTQINTRTGGRIVRPYHTIPWLKNPIYSVESGLAEQAIRTSLTAAVRKRLMTERPVAALLSGGVDSSLIAALVQRELQLLGKPPLETFTVGFKGSADIEYARRVAEHIGSRHTEILTTPDEFLDVLPQVIHDIESYDITTVRASVGNWFVSREISRLSDAKVLFNGDGADELFGSYLYFFRAPDDESYEAEVERLLKEIHMYDVQRSDRSISSHGLEPRTPFLDKQFVSVVRSIGTEFLRPRKGTLPEKWILRKAFADEGLLPAEVLWRQKEAFSDGVSGTEKSWYQQIQEKVATFPTLVEEYERYKVLSSATCEACDCNCIGQKEFTHVPPTSLESYYYRKVFHRFYGASCEKVIPRFWMPKWSGETNDPSARTLSLYT